MRTTVFCALVGIVILSGLVLRTWNVNFDGGLNAHPDERSTTCIYAPTIGLPSSLGEFLNPRRSPLNPLWDPHDARRRSFTYGHFPLYLGILTGGVMRMLAEPASHLPLPDRTIALLARASGPCEGVAVAGRLMIAFLDTWTVFLLFLLGRRLYGAAGGLLAATFYTYTAQAVQLSHFFAMDPASTTFVVLAIYGGLLMVQERSWRGIVFAGLGAGLAISAKFSALPVLAVPVTAALITAVRDERGLASGERRSWVSMRWALSSSVVALLVAFAAFFVTSPYAVLDWVHYIQATVIEQGRMVRGIDDIPYTRQYRGSTPYLYFIEQQVVWGMGLPLGLAAMMGSVWALVRLFLLRAKPGELLVWVWLAPYFGITGAFLAKFNRYMSPVLPFILLFAAGLITWLWRFGSKRQVKLAARLPAALLALLAVGGGLFWSLAYVNGVYGHEHTWITASRWMYDEAPAGSVILWEEWDDALPVTIFGEPGMDAASHGLRHIAWAPYDEDTEEKYEILRQKLKEADYVIYSSNRLYGSVDELPERYPMTIRYYELMFGEQLGFVNVADFTSPPRLLDVSFPDQGADESWTLYDHPRVSIFAKKRELSEGEFDALLGGSWEGAVPLLRGKTSLLNPTLGILDSFADIIRSRAEPLHDQLEPVTVLYDGDISLRGLALGQGEAQLSTQQILDLEQERALWIVLRWQVEPDLTADFAISLRLYDANGALSYQRDHVLGNADLARTSQWSADEEVETLFYVDFAEELLPGEYELRLIVYDADTLTPTVEMDVWEPELVVARLQLAEGR